MGVAGGAYTRPHLHAKSVHAPVRTCTHGRTRTHAAHIRCVGVYGRICVGAYTPVPYGRVGLGGGARTGSIYSPTYFPFWAPQAHQAHTLRRSFQNLDYFIPQNTGKSIRPMGYKAGTRLRVPRIPGSLSRFLVCSVRDHSSSRKERSLYS